MTSSPIQKNARCMTSMAFIARTLRQATTPRQAATATSTLISMGSISAAAEQPAAAQVFAISSASSLADAAAQALKKKPNPAAPSNINSKLIFGTQCAAV